MNSWWPVLIAVMGGLVLLWLTLIAALWPIQWKSADELTGKTTKGQAAEERDRPDARRVAFEEEARLGPRPSAAGRADCARYCFMTD